MATFEDGQQATDEALTEGVRRGVMHNHADDRPLDGRSISVDGRSLINFGSCSYLGLEVHPSLKAGAIAATQRYGTQFSSSRAYISAPPYAEAERLLSQVFDRPAIITSSTTLGHVAALPTLVGARDALLMDHQVHNSVQTAAKLVQVQGCPVELVPHNDMAALDRRIRELSRRHRRIWYAADGLYSMYADFADLPGLQRLMAIHPKLWLYLDDAHSVSWTGTFGRGFALQQLGPLARGRTVVAASLNKSFAAAGGVLTFPDAELRRRVFTVGGPLIFSGPVQPPMLGAIIASARLHQSEEVTLRQRRLLELIRLFNQLADERGLPVVSPSEAPIRCVGAGVPRIAYNLTARLREAGCFIDTAVFPAVSAKRCGARVTITAHHTEQDIHRVVEALAESLPWALAEEGSSMGVLAQSFARQLGERATRLRSAGGRVGEAELVLEHHDSVDQLDPAEWDGLFAGRGAMQTSGLRPLEEVFAGWQPGCPATDRWRFDYWIVRDGSGRPVAATFFTTARWKDDMLSSAELSAAVEAQRAVDPDYLTSTMVAMGCLLTEGDHLYLDRGGLWRPALRLLLQAAREVQERTDASSVLLRDLATADTELHDFLLSEGFVRLPAPNSWVRTMDFRSDEEFLGGLTSRSRRHQRAAVLSAEADFDVRVHVGGDGPGLDSTALDQLYRLYRNVQERNLELNVFPLPRRILDAIAASPGWELVVLRLHDGPSDPVAFVAQHVGEHHLQPLFLGLDYDYVATNGAYQQVLWQALRSAQRLNSPQVLFGMSADRHKARFGARPERRSVYLQSGESFNLDELNRLAQSLALSG